MIGIDIVEVERIKNIYRKHGLLFLEKILDAQEIKDLSGESKRNFFKKLSCYIASKEAIFKACSEDNLDWQDISLRNISRIPLIYIRRPAFKKEIRLSLALNGNIVLSQAIIV